MRRARAAKKKEWGLPSYLNREDASSMVTAGAPANTTEGDSCASGESGMLCSHSHGEIYRQPREGSAQRVLKE